MLGRPLRSDRAVYKIAATWSDGSSRELKNYGLTCDVHRDLPPLLPPGQHHDGLKTGPMMKPSVRSRFTCCDPGCRDTELAPYAEEPSPRFLGRSVKTEQPSVIRQPPANGIQKTRRTIGALFDTRIWRI